MNRSTMNRFEPRVLAVSLHWPLYLPDAFALYQILVTSLPIMMFIEPIKE